MACAGGVAGGVTWVVLVYRLPPKAAALKAAVHRRLRAAGAVYVSRACAVAPSTPWAERAMRRARTMITQAGGSATLLRGQALGGALDLTAAFNAARDREYGDIIVTCADAVADLTAATAAGDFRYERLWERDTGLEQLSLRYRALCGQDLLGAGQAAAAGAALDSYRAALDVYAKGVYATDSAS